VQVVVGIRHVRTRDWHNNEPGSLSRDFPDDFHSGVMSTMIVAHFYDCNLGLLCGPCAVTPHVVAGVSRCDCSFVMPGLDPGIHPTS
jgi:hypothetical protein